MPCQIPFNRLVLASPSFRGCYFVNGLHLQSSLDAAGLIEHWNDLFYFILIFIFWLHQVLVVARGIFVVACGIFVLACRIFCCGAWVLRRGAQSL